MIGIIGYGRFGRLTADYLSDDFPVAVYSRSITASMNDKPHITFKSLENVCQQNILIICVPISAMRETLNHIAPLVGKHTLVVDVCSVKEYPVQWMEQGLPDGVSILATHPMFGPDSASESLTNQKIVLCPVRVHRRRLERIKMYLRSKGLIVIETTPEEHDRQIAVSLALTHFIGRSLSDFGAVDQHIDTEGYKRLTHILEVVENDTWQLFDDMHTYNPYASETRGEFIKAMRRIESRLTR